MPTVAMPAEELFARLGKSYTEKEFDELCFDFGIELDEVTTEEEMKEKSGEATADKGEGSKGTVIYKIDIPANRYDLLCIEGLSRALNVFLGNAEAPVYKVVEPQGGKAERLVMRVKPDTQKVRPFVVCAVLRGLRFDEKNKKSFMDLQEKLHANICRKRTLVAIGTHDLNTLTGPFTYEALPPQDIEFVPLLPSDKGPFKGRDLLDYYNTEVSAKHLKPYTSIIYDKEVYPVIYDSKRTVLSMPPIINGHHSRITLDTTDVLIECTATDETKAHIVLDTVVSMFSEYAASKFEVEAVDVVYEGRGEGGEDVRETTPRMHHRAETASIDDIRSITGVSELTPEQMCAFCTKMQLGPAKQRGNDIQVTVPPTRSDILHAVDIIEDVAIAYGYNNIALRVPATLTVGAPLKLNHFCDLLRDEVARAGYCEVLTHGLCSTVENFAKLRREEGPVVSLSNPAIEEYQVVRTTLLPGALKVLQHNRDLSVKDGLRLFEISDVVLVDKDSDTGCTNHRRLCATYTGLTAGFEVIHGLVDRLLMLMQVAPTAAYTSSTKGGSSALGGPWREGLSFDIEEGDDPCFFPGRCAFVRLHREGQPPLKVGTFGVLHPEVLSAFELSNPSSAVELDLEPML